MALVGAATVGCTESFAVVLESIGTVVPLITVLCDDTAGPLDEVELELEEVELDPEEVE